MALKLKKTKTPRKHKVSPNTAGPARKATQEMQHKKNEANKLDATYLKPWEKVKLKRLAIRTAAGKTYENWLKKNSNYKSTGPNKVEDLKQVSEKEFFAR